VQLRTVNYVNFSDFLNYFDQKYYRNYLYELKDSTNPKLLIYLVDECILDDDTVFLEIDEELLNSYQHPPVIQNVLKEMYQLALPLFPDKCVVINMKD
jgi:hypothetical protein